MSFYWALYVTSAGFLEVLRSPREAIFQRKYICVQIFSLSLCLKFKTEDFCKPDEIHFIVSVIQNQALITQKLLSIVVKEDRCRCVFSKGKSTTILPFLLRILS